MLVIYHLGSSVNTASPYRTDFDPSGSREPVAGYQRGIQGLSRLQVPSAHFPQMQFCVVREPTVMQADGYFESHLHCVVLEAASCPRLFYGASKLFPRV